MLPLLLAASSSVFIPPVAGKPQFKPLPLSSLDSVLNASNLVVALGAKPRDAQLIFRFFDAQPLFPDARFELFDPFDFIKSGRPRPRSPFLAVFRDGVQTAAIGPIQSEVFLAHLLDLHLTKSRPVLDSLEGALFGAPLTVIAHPSQFSAAYNLTTSGVPANLVIGSPRVTSELNLSDSECSVFREADLTFANFPCDSASYSAASIPAFSYYDAKRLPKSRELIFAFHSKEPEDEIIAFLAEQGALYPDFRFVYAPRGETYAITEFTRYVFHHPYTNIAVINYSGRFDYDLSGLITREQFDEEPFVPDVWRGRIRQVVDAVRGGGLPKIFQTEYEGDREAGNVQYATGTNFLTLVANATVDCFALLHKQACPRCPAVFTDVFRRFAAAVERFPNVTYEFVHTDTTNNRFEGGFPVKAGSIILYPKGDKRIKVLPLETYDLLLWFAQKYASVPHPLKFEPPRKEDLAKIEDRAAEIALRATPEARVGLEEVLADLRAEVGKNEL
jgi:hypothetical protein